MSSGGRYRVGLRRVPSADCLTRLRSDAVGRHHLNRRRGNRPRRITDNGFGNGRSRRNRGGISVSLGGQVRRSLVRGRREGDVGRVSFEVDCGCRPGGGVGARYVGA